MHVHRSRRLLAALLATALLVVSCGSDEGTDGAAGDDVTAADDTATDEATTDEVTTDDDPAVDDPDAEVEGEGDAEEPDPAPAVDPAEIGADELGLVPVLMYHRVLEGGGSEYDATPEELREEFTWLFENGYRPVRTVDLVRGEFDVPAGTTPVVLTFDDSTREQAFFDDDGEIHPDSSMGILIDVASQFDDVDPVASLYVITSSLFGGTATGSDVLVHLHELGMEIGNHTHNHPSLGSLDDAGVQDELARNVAEVRSLVPDAEVVTLSLPLGVFPQNRSLVAGGSGEAGDYSNEGVLLVGSNPAPSPFHAEFDPLAIPRIRSSPSWDGGEPDYGSRFWLEQLERGEAYRRFVSDGDPTTISFPADRADELDDRFADRANPY